MSITLKEWKELIEVPRVGWFNRLFGRVYLYEILIRERVTDEDNIHYYTAWVNLSGNLKERYGFESERSKNMIGTDTYEYNKSEKPNGDWDMEFDDGLGFGHGYLIFRIRNIIEEHRAYQKEGKCKE